MDIQPAVIVVGPFRGGTSCVAGVMHHLGVYMGRWFRRPRKANQKGFFEAERFGQICRRAYKEPWLTEQTSYRERVKAIRGWGIMSRSNIASTRLMGVKHPTLCIMIPEVLEAWGPETKIVSVVRPITSVMSSLIARGWGWPRQAVKRVLPAMVQARDEALEDVPAEQVLRIDYELLLAEPEAVVTNLVEFLGIYPTPNEIRAAVRFVDPKLRHF